MTCPKCHGPVGVKESRDKDKLNAIYRRRICHACGHTFSTIEYEVDVKRTGGRIEYPVKYKDLERKHLALIKRLKAISEMAGKTIEGETSDENPCEQDVRKVEGIQGGEF